MDRERWARRYLEALASGEGVEEVTEGSNPVVFVSYGEAREYAEWLSEVEGRPYGLPTEAQWERAARGSPRRQKYYWRDEERPCDYAHYDDQKASTLHAVHVGSYKPNDFGLYDMIGNVSEWCIDPPRRYEAREEVDPTGGPDGQFGSSRAVRGGSWALPLELIGLGSRDLGPVEGSNQFVDFRLCVSVVAEEGAGPLK